MFKACNLVCKHDVATTRFLLPYIVHNALAHGSDAARDSVRAEMEAVLRTGHSSREGELCVQEVFSLLDALKKAVAEARTTATITASGARFSLTIDLVSLVHGRQACSDSSPRPLRHWYFPSISVNFAFLPFLFKG